MQEISQVVLFIACCLICCFHWKILQPHENCNVCFLPVLGLNCPHKCNMLKPGYSMHEEWFENNLVYKIQTSKFINLVLCYVTFPICRLMNFLVFSYFHYSFHLCSAPTSTFWKSILFSTEFCIVFRWMIWKSWPLYFFPQKLMLYLLLLFSPSACL